MVLRIFKMISTSGFLAALVCTKFVFGWGSPRPSCWFKGPYLGEGEGKESGKGEKGIERERKGPAPLSHIHGSALLVLPEMANEDDYKCQTSPVSPAGNRQPILTDPLRQSAINNYLASKLRPNDTVTVTVNVNLTLILP